MTWQHRSIVLSELLILFTLKKVATVRGVSYWTSLLDPACLVAKLGRGLAMRSDAAILSLLTTAAFAIDSPPTMIKRQLLENYGDPSVRPGWSNTAEDGGTAMCLIAPDSVHAQVYVTKILPLHEIESSWELNGFLRMWWHDPQLAFNSSIASANGRCQELESLEFTGQDRERLWTPDIYLQDAIEFEAGLSSPATSGLSQLLRVYPDGTVFSSQQTRFKQTCTMDFAKAPFDTQRCKVSLGLFANSEDQVTLHWKPGVEPLDNTLSYCFSKWAITGVEARNVSRVYPIGTYSVVEADVHFTRLPSTLLGVYLIPALFFVFLSYLGFYIDPASTPARVTLGMITILV